MARRMTAILKCAAMHRAAGRDWALCNNAKLIAKLNVPIGHIDEMPPAIVVPAAEGEVDEWTPFRAHRFADEVHTGFVREPVAFARIARDARADDVFPRGRAAFVAWHDVVEVEFFAVENFAAVLAGVFVALKNIVPREL